MLTQKAVHMSPCQGTIALSGYKYPWGAFLSQASLGKAQSPSTAFETAAKGERQWVRPGVKWYPKASLRGIPVCKQHICFQRVQYIKTHETHGELTLLLQTVAPKPLIWGII